MGQFDAESPAARSLWTAWLFDGSGGRATRMAIALVVSIWFAYVDPWDLAYIYTLPLLTMICLALYPHFISSLSMMCTLMIPYSVLNAIYVCAVGTLVSYLLEYRDWSEERVRWVPWAIFVAVSLLICQARVCLNNKICYGGLLSGQYIFVNIFYPLYMLSLRGMRFVLDARMMASLRLIIQIIDKLPILPDILKKLLPLLTHKDCDHLFAQNLPGGGPDELLGQLGNAESLSQLTDVIDARVVANQVCRVKVPIYLRLSGGFFEFSRDRMLTISTDSAAQFLQFQYRPGHEFFFNTAWVARGQTGLMRGTMLGMLVSAVIVIVAILTRPDSRSRLLLKVKIIEAQRRLLKTLTSVLEGCGAVSPNDRFLERIYLVSYPPPPRLGRTACTDFFVRRYLPPMDLDNLPSRLQELNALSASAGLESGLAQPPGLSSAAGLQGLVSVLTQEAASLGAFTRASTTAAPSNATWHHPIGQQMATGACQLVSCGGDQVAAWVRPVFLTYHRITLLIERALSADEACGRDRGVMEILSDLRHQFQLELTEMYKLLQRTPANAFAQRVAIFIGLTGIAKCKYGILYIEGELQKDVGTWLRGLVIAAFGSLLVYIKGIVSGWRDVFNFGRGRPDKCPEPELACVAAGSCRTMDGRIPWYRNAEIWTGLRFCLGECLIFSVFLFNLNWAQTTILKAQRDHMRRPELVAETLTVSAQASALLRRLFPSANNGAGMDTNVELIPGLAWIDASILKISKIVPWTFLGYYTTNLITWQGTVKRTSLRLAAMFVSTVIAWIVLLILLKAAGGNSAFALDDDNSLKLQTISIIGAVATVLVYAGVLGFSNPFNRRFAFDVQWGYFGQILCYHFLVLSLGLCWDPRQTRDELCLMRIIGHLLGAALSLVLTFCVFPVDTNVQQRYRISNLAAVMRRSFVALHGYEAGAAPADPWRRYLEETVTWGQYEIAHYDKIVDDANIADVLDQLRTDRVLVQLADVLKQRFHLRKAARQAIDDIDGRDKVFTRDATLKNLADTLSKTPTPQPPPQTLQRDHSELQRMRRRFGSATTIRPASPYTFVSTDEPDQQSPRRWSPVATPITRFPSISEDSASSDDAPLTTTTTPPPAKLSAQDFLRAHHEEIRTIAQLWIRIEYAIRSMANRKFDFDEWQRGFQDELAHAAPPPLRPDDLMSVLRHELWSGEIACFRRAAGYIQEYTTSGG